MSFILDALRKSEHERQRQGGPGLAEVAVATPRTRTSVWAAAAVVLLIANLAAVGILMLRRGRAEDGTAAPTAPVAAAPATSVAAAPPTTAASPAPAAPPDAPPVAQQVPVQAAPSTTAANTPPMLQPADASAPGTRNPLADEVTEDAMLDDPVLAERAASVPSGPPAVSEYPTRPGSVVYERLPGAGGASTASADLPTVDDVGTGLPEMHVDLHVYAANPQERFVFVNKRKYHEGETLQEGPRVEEITRDGVVLSQHGRRFILPRQ
jgi:general secretion pathway protein B